jgi:hypothetical protein
MTDSLRSVCSVNDLLSGLGRGLSSGLLLSRLLGGSRLGSSLLTLLLLGQKDGMDVGEDTTGSDGDTAEQLVQLLVVADGQLNVAGSDTSALVIAGGVTGQLEDLSSEVLKDGREIDGGTATNSGGIAASAEESGHTTDGELKTSASRSRLRLSSGSLALASSASLTSRFTSASSRHCR